MVNLTIFNVILVLTKALLKLFKLSGYKISSNGALVKLFLHIVS